MFVRGYVSGCSLPTDITVHKKRTAMLSPARSLKEENNTYRPNTLHLSQSVATSVRFRSENRVLRYALRQNKNVATPPVANFRGIL